MASKSPQTDTLAEDAATFRAFNRMYTRFIGTLNEGLLETSFGLAEARVLYELATHEKLRASDVREALGLDAGYLSRILTRFEREGLLRRKAAVEDARAAELSLTTKGKSAFAQLNRRSEKQARDILGALPEGERAELMGAMGTMKRALDRNATSRSYTLRSHRVGDMGTVARSEGIGYAEQYGWDGTFEALVAKIAAEFVQNFDAEREYCWIADVDGQHAGHIFLVKHPEKPDTAKLRLLFVEPRARGLGLGEALVAECIRKAREVGYKTMVLWTQSMLTGALRIYQKAGFRLIGEQPHHSFGKDLIGQEWQLDL